IGQFSSGRLNSIIERYSALIDTKNIDIVFSNKELEILYEISKETATRERGDWQDLKKEKLILKLSKSTEYFDINGIIEKLSKLNTYEELSLIEKIENYWLSERIRLFNEYRNNKIKN
ncbi:MAG TPA: hypothetical protein PKL69_11360, partial [Agitococcus sp.]|nr:hypothetical protein [Agitococcus sp.]